MMTKLQTGYLIITAVLAIGLFTGLSNAVETTDDVQIADERVYEMRTYTTHPGKLDDLNARFSDHTIRIFGKHNMISVGYWIPEDPERSENTLIYILSHPSREAAESNWQGFINDPEWQAAYQASRDDGPIVSNVESVFMKATPYSQIR